VRGRSGGLHDGALTQGRGFLGHPREVMWALPATVIGGRCAGDFEVPQAPSMPLIDTTLSLPLMGCRCEYSLSLWSILTLLIPFYLQTEVCALAPSVTRREPEMIPGVFSRGRTEPSVILILTTLLVGLYKQVPSVPFKNPRRLSLTSASLPCMSFCFRTSSHSWHSTSRSFRAKSASEWLASQFVTQARKRSGATVAEPKPRISTAHTPAMI